MGVRGGHVTGVPRGSDLALSATLLSVRLHVASYTSLAYLQTNRKAMLRIGGQDAQQTCACH